MLRSSNQAENLGMRGIDLEVRQGEILGIVGVAGNGQKPLVETVCGLRSREQGNHDPRSWRGRDFSRNELVTQALSYIPEDDRGWPPARGLTCSIISC